MQNVAHNCQEKIKDIEPDALQEIVDNLNYDFQAVQNFPVQQHMHPAETIEKQMCGAVTTIATLISGELPSNRQFYPKSESTEPGTPTARYDQ